MLAKAKQLCSNSNGTAGHLQNRTDTYTNYVAITIITGIVTYYNDTSWTSSCDTSVITDWGHITVTCSPMYHVDGEHLLVGTGSLTSNHPRPTQVLYTNSVFLAWRSMEGGGREGGGGYRRGGEGGAEEEEREEGEKGQRSINSYVAVLFNKLLTNDVCDLVSSASPFSSISSVWTPPQCSPEASCGPM